MTCPTGSHAPRPQVTAFSAAGWKTTQPTQTTLIEILHTWLLGVTVNAIDVRRVFCAVRGIT